MASISSADDSSSSGDEEMEHHPTMNPPIPPVPARQETDGSEEDDDDEEESDGAGWSTKHLLQPLQQSHGVEGSSDEDEEEESESDYGTDSDEEQASEGSVLSPALAETFQHKTKAAPTELTKAHQETGGDGVESSDEIGENGVVIKLLPHPLPPPPPQEKDGSADDDEEEESDTESDEASSTEPEPQVKVNVPSPHLAKSPPSKRKAATAQLPMSPSPKRTAAVAPTEVPKSPSSKKPAAVAAMQIPKSPRPNEVARSPEVTAPAKVQNVCRELQFDKEKHLEEKSKTYWYLWQDVLALDAEHPGLCFKKEFLKIPDDKARALDTKIKKQEISKLKVHLQHSEIKNEVIKTLIRLIK